MKQPLSRQEGASVLEFLVIIPVLLTLAYTAIEFGAIFVRLNTITKSVQDATRYLSDHLSIANSDDAQILSIATKLVQNGSVTGTDQVLPGAFDAPIISNLGNHIQVSVVYNHTPVAGEALSNLLQTFLGGEALDLSFPMTASSTMRYAR